MGNGSNDLTRRKAALSDSRRALLLRRLRGQKAQKGGEAIPSGSLAGRLPLSYTQQRVWFLQQLYPDNRAYNMSEAWRLRGPLDMETLGDALNTIAARHAALRTRFKEDGAEPAQEVLDHVRLPLSLIDLRHLPAAEKEEALEQLLVDHGNTPFDLGQAPLARAWLLRLGEDEHVLQLVLHHIITDEWSNDIIWRELRAFYAGPRVPAPPDPAIQYPDYARWQREQAASGAFDGQIRYWRDKLGDEPPLLQLPADRPRGARQSLRGGTVRRTLAPELLAALQKIGDEAGASLFMTLIAAFQALLYRMSGQETILTGTPIANRGRTETKDVIGMFINTAVIRSDFSPGMNFAQLLEQVREVALEALANQELPFDLLVQALQPERDLSHNPLFQAMFVFRSDKVERSLPNLHFEAIKVNPGVAKFDLTLFAGEDAGRLYSAVEYSSDRFERETAERILDRWAVLLEAVARDPQASLASLPILDAAERSLVVEQWNETTRPLTETRPLQALIAAQAARAPAAPAIISSRGTLSYGELDARAARLAAHLRLGGVTAGTPVGLFMERSPQMLVGILGILKAGGAYVPLAPEYPRSRIAFALDDTQAPLVVTTADLQPLLPETEAAVLVLEEALSVSAGETADLPPASLDDLAYIIYTSGSTGTPKGVMVSQRNLLASTLARAAVYDERPGRYLLLSSFAFDSSVAGIFWTLASGGALVLPAPGEEQDVPRLAEIISRERVTHTLALPALYRLLVTYAPPESLQSLRTVIVAGEACPPDLAPLHYQRLPETALYNEYGPTEATVWCSVYRLPGGGGDGPVPIGRPIANTRLYILDADQRPVPIGVPGELYVAGANVTQGYWGNPELTAKQFPTLVWNGQRVYRSGDLARWLPSGNIEFLGRADNQVKIRGYRIEPGEVAARLAEHEMVQEAVVIAAGERTKQLVAYAVAAEADRPDAESLRAFLSRMLPEYMVPAQILYLDALPRTPNGKVDVNALPAPPVAQERTVVSPRTPAEEILAQIWAEALGLEQVSVDDKFFALGGDSLMSIQVIARARAEGLILTPRQMFEEQTIARLAAVARQDRPVEEADALESGPLPLTPIQQWFFAQDLADPNHWNQAAWFELAGSVTRQQLQRALDALAARHAQLRARFQQADGAWRAEIGPPEESIPLAIVPLEGPLEDALRAEGQKLQTGLDLSAGPLMRAALFTFGDDQPPRLLLVIHHLAVDAVSWGIIADDLARALGQVTAGKAPVLPPPPTGYGAWARLQARLARGHELRRQAAYWQEAIEPAAPLPHDLAGSANTEGLSREIARALEVEVTEQLLRPVHDAYHTRIDDILLAALAQTLADWTGEERVLLTLERHGREPLDPVLDMSQTVGWFTALFPFSTGVPAKDDPGALIRTVKERLRAVPEKGIGFGILRTLGDEEVRRELATLPQPQVLFNYLGQVRAAGDGPLRRLRGDAGPAIGPANERAHLLDINAQVVNGRLVCRWRYPTTYFHEQTIAALAEDFNAQLRRLIAHCLAVEDGSYTPSDFPLAQLAQEELDELSDLLSGLDG